MKRTLLFIITLIFSGYTYCCSCIGKATFKQEFKRSNVVVVGKIIDKKVFEIKDTLMPAIKILKAEYTLQIQTVYKGKIKEEKIKIITGIGSGDCGVEFNIGKEYIVYCSYENKYFEQGDIVDKYLSTDICRRTRLIDDKEEIKLLDKKCKKTKAAL